MVYPAIGSGSVVRFRLESVLCPDLENILHKATERLEVTGKVILLSDAGGFKDSYAVVEVGGIATPLIVPVREVQTYQASTEEARAENGR